MIFVIEDDDEVVVAVDFVGLIEATADEVDGFNLSEVEFEGGDDVS